MWSQCDMEGNQHLLLDSIVDYWMEGDAVKAQNMYTTTHNGQKRLRKTTKRWKLGVLWKDGSTSWERLADLKESNPIEVAEYAIAQGIDHEPAFCWWVPYTLWKKIRLYLQSRNNTTNELISLGFGFQRL